MDEEKNNERVIQEGDSITPSVDPPPLDVFPTPDVIRFNVGQFVYLRLDPTGSPGIVMGLVAQPGHYKYLVRWEDLEDCMHFDFELSNKPCLRDVSRIVFVDDDD